MLRLRAVRLPGPAVLLPDFARTWMLPGPVRAPEPQPFSGVGVRRILRASLGAGLTRIAELRSVVEVGVGIGVGEC